MRNWFKKTIGFLAALVLASAFTSSVFGVASFARQTGLECGSCHASAPGYPALNSFGQAFKAGGYVMGNEDRMIGDGDRLSIPVALNFSLVTKIRATYEKAGTAGATATVKGDVPDEFALFFAGRLGKNVGFVTEYNADGPVSFKMPFVFDVGPAKLGVVVHWTDAAGPGWMFENMSTGQVKNIRPAENFGTVNKINDTQYGAAAGLGLYVWHPMAFLAYTPSVPGANASGASSLMGSHYIRVAVTPTVGGLELGIGGSYWAGYDGLKTSGGTVVRNQRDVYSVDAQLMGDVGIPLGAFISFNGQANRTGNTVSGLAIYVEGGVLPDLINVGLGYSMTLNSTVVTGTTENKSDINFGVKANILMNLRLQLELVYHLNDGAGNAGGMKFQAMLFGSF